MVNISHVKAPHKLIDKIKKTFYVLIVLVFFHFSFSFFGSIHVFESWQEKRADILQISLNEWLNSYRANLIFASYSIKDKNSDLAVAIQHKNLNEIKSNIAEFKTLFKLDYVFIELQNEDADKSFINSYGYVNQKKAEKNRKFIKDFSTRPSFKLLTASKASFIRFETLLGNKTNGNTELMIGIRIPVFDQSKHEVANIFILKNAQMMDDAILNRMAWVVDLQSINFLGNRSLSKTNNTNLLDKLKQVFVLEYHELIVHVSNLASGKRIGHYKIVESTNEIRMPILISLLQNFIFLIVLFLALFYFHRILKYKLLEPFAEAVQISADVSSGLLDERLKFMYTKHKKNWTEIDVFGEQFNHLLDGLADKQKELTGLNDNLESVVRVRTGELIKANKNLHKQAHTDALTGVANRHSFDIYWKKLIQEFVTEKKQSIGIAIIDCDHFKGINDTYGHDIGDKVLNIVCRNIEQHISQEESLVRLGGDEFAIIFSNKHTKDIMQNIKEIVESVQNFSTEDIGLLGNLSISVGVAVADDSNRNDALEIIKHADTAMYVAKQNLVTKAILFDKEKHAGTENQLNHVSTQQVLDAIETGDGLILLFQPVYNVKTQKIEYFELLSRFSMEESYIYPNIFMPIIERTRMQVQFDKAVVKKAYEILELKQIKKGVGFSLNLSAESLLLDGVCEWFNDLVPFLTDHKIIIEITETTLIQNLDFVSKQINKFKALGFKVALDDFGSGYSSISYLAHLPVNIIKFDISLTRAAYQKERTAMLIESLVADLTVMGYSIVVEGIEDEGMFKMITLMQPSHLQGYYFNKPLNSPDYAVPTVKTVS